MSARRTPAEAKLHRLPLRGLEPHLERVAGAAVDEAARLIAIRVLEHDLLLTGPRERIGERPVGFALPRLQPALEVPQPEDELLAFGLDRHQLVEPGVVLLRPAIGLP